MSFISKRSLIERIRKGKESREKLVSSNLDKGIAFQIRATRDQRDWTQSDLAAKSGMTQNNISRLESPEYGKHTISSLKRIADAFDVALVVRFVPFCQYIDWLSGTPFLDEGIRPESLAVPSFEDEEKIGRYENTVKYFGLHVTPKVSGVGISYAGFAVGNPQPSANVIKLHGPYQGLVQVPITEGKVA